MICTIICFIRSCRHSNLNPQNLITARKLSCGKVMFYTCLSAYSQGVSCHLRSSPMFLPAGVCSGERGVSVSKGSGHPSRTDIYWWPPKRAVRKYIEKGPHNNMESRVQGQLLQLRCSVFATEYYYSQVRFNSIS